MHRNPFVDRGFEDRRSHLADRLLAPLGTSLIYQEEPTNGVDTASVHRYLEQYHARLQHYHMALLAGQDVAGANAYYEHSLDLDSSRWNHPRNEPDWKMIPLTRTYYECRDVLSPAARDRLAALMQEFRDGIGFGGTENHIINRVVLVLVIDQALGIEDEKTAHARALFKRWVWRRGHRGYHEFNSPTYHRHCLLPLLQLYDLHSDQDLVERACMALDQIMAEVALESIHGVRGGPWHRAVSKKELQDRRHDVAWMASYVYFGNCDLPAKLTNGAPWATTRYRVPRVIYELATQLEERGSYEILHRVDSARPSLNAYYWMTPWYSLGCFQDQPPFECFYYGSSNRANLQPWQLTFGQPELVLGVWRDLEEISNYTNSSTTLFQYRNALLFRGDWLDYNGNLGAPVVTELEGRTVHCYRVPLTQGEVYIAISKYSGSDCGALECVAGSEVDSWDAFREQAGAATAYESGQQIHYTTLAGDVLEWKEDAAYVNGRPFATRDYPLCRSPYVNAGWESGCWEIRFKREMLTLDFTDAALSCGEGLSATYYQGEDFAQPVVRRTDQTLDYNWGTTMPDKQMPAGPFSVKWRGSVVADYTGHFQFTLKTTGKVRMYVDGQAVIDEWAPVPEEQNRYGHVNLCKGARTPIEVEYAHDGSGPAKLVCTWQNGILPEQTLGLSGELYSEAQSPLPSARLEASTLAPVHMASA